MSIRVNMIRDYYQVGGHNETSRLENGVKVTDTQGYTVKKEWITEESFTEKANEIFDKVDKKFQRKFSKAKNDDERNQIEESRDTEYRNRLHKWLYPEETDKGGRKEGSTIISDEDFKSGVLEAYVNRMNTSDARIKPIDLANDLDLSQATFYRRLSGCEWTMQTVRAEAKKKYEKSLVIES